MAFGHSRFLRYRNFCSGSNDGSVIIIANGGTAPYSYSIDGGATFVTNNVFNGLSSGTYTCLAKDSANINSNVNNVVIQSPSPLNCTLSNVGSTVTVTATGGNAPYSFSVNGGPYQSSPVFTNLNSGIHVFQVRDGNNCVSTCIATINPSAFEVLIGATLDNPTSSIFVANTLQGTAPYTYTWYNNGNAIGPTMMNSLNVLGGSGCYTVSVIDANNQVGYSTMPYCIQSNGLVANSDTFSVSLLPNGNTISSYNLLTNDLINGSSAENQVGTIISGFNLPSGFSIDNNGLVTIANTVISGTYNFTYNFSNILLPVSSNITSVSITVNQTASGISLKSFVDLNNNGIKDTNEVFFNNGTFSYVVNNNGITNNVTSPNGQFFIPDSNTVNSYDFTFSINNGFTSCYSSSTSSLNDVIINGGTQTLNFPVTIINCNDISVSLLNYSIPPRPGFIYNNQIIYKNNGNQTIPSGTITFTKDVLLGTIVSTVPSGASISGNSLTYSFTNLLPNELRTLQVNIQVPTIPTINLGQLVTNSASITVPANDFNTFNNTSGLTQTVIGSYDPNDKMESHGSKIVHSSFTANDYLRYTIRFENTGTFSAENVRVNDLLNSKLDETSIKMINSSHAYTLNRTGNELNWNFNDINLPPSVPNTTIGHGYITFEIKPKPGYVVGDIIPNTASIFFDFNPPIITNTFNTEFVTTLSIPKFNDSQFVIFPNPTSGILNILSKGNIEIIESISISNVLGDILKETKVNMSSSEIDMSSLQKGLYFINIKSGNSQKTVKVILQ